MRKIYQHSREPGQGPQHHTRPMVKLYGEDFSFTHHLQTSKPPSSGKRSNNGLNWLPHGRFWGVKGGVNLYAVVKAKCCNAKNSWKEVWFHFKVFKNFGICIIQETTYHHAISSLVLLVHHLGWIFLTQRICIACVFNDGLPMFTERT